MHEIINKLRTELQKPLPGKGMHQRMLPEDRLSEPIPETNDSKQGAVLLLLIPRNEKLNIVFIRRPASMKYHAGQIAFPGGGVEPGDKNSEETAIRETVEETGIDGNLITLLGELSPLYVMVSNYTVRAFVGWIQPLPCFKINKSEVEALFIIPLDNLIKNGTLEFQEVETHLGIKKFPGYFVNGIFIWGATAMILTEFIEIYKKCLSSSES